jgi:hypothetical protein
VFPSTSVLSVHAIAEPIKKADMTRGREFMSAYPATGLLLTKARKPFAQSAKSSFLPKYSSEIRFVNGNSGEFH